ncbi:MAG: sigma-54-dependent transcriptional regulator [Syntrophobacteraceae bacterium]
MARVLIVDDDPAIRNVLSEFIRSMGHETTACGTLEQGLKTAKQHDFDLVFLDLEFPDGYGLDALPTFLRGPGMPQVIIITGAGTRNAAEIAFRHGAWNFVVKPLNFEDVRVYTSWALQYREEKLNLLKPKHLKRDAIIGGAPALQTCLDELAQAAATDTSVLITGETGVGKELFAKALHENSSRASTSLVVADCGAIPETLAESVFFGHEKGAFTGADLARLGLLKQAHRGTLFLDEIGDLPLPLQPKLLRAIQERRFRALGSDRETESDFRVVAATNKDLHHLVENGLFRRDLLFRLNGVHIRLPALRERKEDLPVLVTHHLMRLGRRYGAELKGVSAELMEALQAYDWPGNIRELVQVLERAFAAARNEETIHPHHLPPEIRARSVYRDPVDPLLGRSFAPLPTKELGNDPVPTWKAFISEAERHYLMALMERARGDREEAVRLSGLSQSKLYMVLKEHNIPRFRNALQ